MLLVAAAVTWNLVNLRAETLPVTYLDDSSLHEQMVRFATGAIQQGRLPLTMWFPYLGLGSPQFLHYQSLPAMLAGLLGTVIGANAAYRWTLYLLLSFWPLSVYAGARLLGANRIAAALSAAMAPFLVSVPGVGYEQKAYVWIGYGVWTQLWASMTLPLAWGFSWRAIRERRGYLPAAGLVALTAALHFETGYLALAPILVWPFVAGRPLVGRLRSAAIVLIGALGATAWVLVPLVAQRNWAAVNEPLQGTPLVNGYGAGRMLSWLITGQLLDHARLPVVTAFAAVGLALAIWRCRSDLDERAILVVLAISLILSFGRTTWGSLTHVIPGAGDVFFRRFLMGVQLAALLLAGRGAAAAARTVWARAGPLGSPPRARLARHGRRSRTHHHRAVGCGARPHSSVVAARSIRSPQQRGDHGAAARRRHRGRAGQPPAADGEHGRTGARVRGDAVELGSDLHRRRRPRLQIPGEPRRRRGRLHVAHGVADDRPGVLLRRGRSGRRDPVWHSLPDPAGRLSPADSGPADPPLGPYVLWQTPVAGYVSLGRIVGALTADRADVGVRSIPLLDSALPTHGDALQIKWRTPVGDSALLPAHAPIGAPIGAVLSTETDLAAGASRAVVALNRAGVVVLSTSFDPGWTATGRRTPAPDADRRAGAGGRPRAARPTTRSRLRTRGRTATRHCSPSRWPRRGAGRARCTTPAHRARTYVQGLQSLTRSADPTVTIAGSGRPELRCEGLGRRRADGESRCRWSSGRPRSG